MRVVFYLLIFLLLTGCHFFGPIDEDVFKKIIIAPKEEDFIGHWEIDSFSYQLINEQYELGTAKVELIFGEKEHVQALNFPDFVNDDYGKSINGQLITASGDWKIIPDHNTWKLNLNFNNGIIRSSSYQLYQKDTNIIILKFIGDPDQADRLRFIKAEK